GSDSNFPGSFVLYRYNLKTMQSTALPFGGPIYDIPFSGMGSSDGNTAIAITLRPSTLYSYDLAITPDGSRAEFAIRAHYYEKNAHFPLLISGASSDCVANYEIVE